MHWLWFSTESISLNAVSGRNELFPTKAESSVTAPEPTFTVMNTDLSAIDKPGALSILKALPRRIKKHNVVVMSAGIAFYGFLALVPTLLATVSIYGLVNQGNEDQIAQQIEDAAGSLDEDTKGFIQGILVETASSSGKTSALVFSIVLALFSASGAVQKLITSVSLAYDAVDERPGWKVRLAAYGFTVGAIVGVVLMVTIVGVVPAVLSVVDLGGPTEALIAIAQFPIFALLFAGGLTMLYRYGPYRQPRTPWWNGGAVLATAIWVLFAVAFSFYSSNAGALPASYALLGAVAALMIFLQFTSLAVILGAEYNAEVESIIHLAAVADNTASAPPEPIGFGKALAGLAALFILNRRP